MTIHHYTTESEKVFISGLGRWAETKVHRLELLRLYQKALMWRHNWNGMNMVEIERHLVGCIERETVLAR